MAFGFMVLTLALLLGGAMAGRAAADRMRLSKNVQKPPEKPAEKWDLDGPYRSAGQRTDAPGVEPTPLAPEWTFETFLKEGLVRAVHTGGFVLWAESERGAYVWHRGDGSRQPEGVLLESVRAAWDATKMRERIASAERGAAKKS
jgi:hypothetical protein